MTEATASHPAKRKAGRTDKSEDAAPKNGDARGGARPGAGRKSAALEAEIAPSLVILRKSQAKKAAFDAQMSELEFNVKAGKYVLRSDVVQSNSTAYAMVAQAMRSIPDNLERRLGISPEVAEEIGVMIEEAMDALYEQMGKFEQ